jgi:putative effector of murein hydrolase
MTDSLPDIHEIWVYLSGSPLLALFLTLAAYQIGVVIYERSGRHPLCNPVAIAVLVVALAITAIDMPYARYFEGAQFVHFLLGTATVSLAVPIHRGIKELRGRLVPLLAALLAGGATSIASAVGISRWLGADHAIVAGFYAKSVTAPIAMGVAERIHASPTLTAVFAITTGILGAVLARFVLDAVGSRAWWQRGFALGIAAHGIGTARAFSVNEEAGRFASLAMGLHGIVGAVLIPLLVRAPGFAAP